MRLHKIIASSTSKAIVKIHEQLGSEAMIYSTRTTHDGVEVLAGIASDGVHDLPAANQFVEMITNPGKCMNELVDIKNSAIEQVSLQVKQLAEIVTKLIPYSDQVASKQVDASPHSGMATRSFIAYLLYSHGFSHVFCQQFIDDFLSADVCNGLPTEEEVYQHLTGFIKTPEMEIIDDQKICALVGPTGSGKTTSIQKIAKRFIGKYRAEAIGIITTDFKDVRGKHLLIDFCQSLNIDLEFAGSPKQIRSAVKAFMKKELILIDTPGISHRNQEGIQELQELLTSSELSVATYLTLPFNLQVAVADEMRAAFATHKLEGCVLTKMDESVTHVPMLEFAMRHVLPIAYICNGQNLDKDIRHYYDDEIVRFTRNMAV